MFSLTDLETRRLKLQEDMAKVVAQEAKLNVSRQELVNARLDLGTIQADYQEKRAKALSDRSSAVSYQAEANGEIAIEPLMDVANVASAVVYMAGLPLTANVQFMTVMATKMPFVGRG